LIDYDLGHPVNNKKPPSRQVTLGAVMNEVVHLYQYKSPLGSRRAVSAENLIKSIDVS